MKRNVIDKVIDFYLDFPLLVDVVIIVLILIVNCYMPFVHFHFANTTDATNLLSNLISAEVSLAGFILAALTIIVTFRSNIKAKGVHEATNALELILSSKHYPGIVRVFRTAMIELVVCLITGYILWICIANISNKCLNVGLICLTVCTILAVGRTLYILFITLSMEKVNDEV